MIKETYQQTGLTHHQLRTDMLFRPYQCSSSTFRCLFLDAFLLVIVFLCCFACPCYASCNQIDHNSLWSFYTKISTSKPLNWSSGVNCCLWEGIQCVGNDRVTGLWLPSRDLRGPISPSIANLTGLTHLNLSHNWLSGPLPDGFFNSLTQIQTIDLSSNHFNGTYQSSFVGPVKNLISLNVSNNFFAGGIPLSMCLNSPLLKLVDFSFNELIGQIPKGFGNCSELDIFRAGFNNLSGQIPNDIYSALHLKELSLPANSLYGTLSEALVNLTNIAILELYANGFTGVIPLDIGKLSNLKKLLLHINQLTGSLPPSLMNCTKLTTLNLRVNSLTGELFNLDFSNLLQLSSVDLGNNNFTGRLPKSLFSCKSLTAIRLAANQLEGQIVPDILALESLSFLSISKNKLTNITGAIQILMGCKNLSTIILSKNFINETIPDEEIVLDSQGFQMLQVLGLGGCQLTGQIPAWLAKLRDLEVLDLSLNQITGSIPSWVGSFPNLFYLELSFNLLSGNFPKELTGLQRLASEEGADQVDRSYLELPVFVRLNNASYSYQQYNQLSNLPPAIYLGNNRLSGNIPIEIGQLKFIHVLDLSNNSFSGNIPHQLSNLTNLEKLDLSGNNLSGEIPASLKSNNFLSSFSVANNNLQGPIPTGGQFETFPESSFLGNPGLCGPVLHRPCSNESNSSPHARKRSPKKKIIAGLILGICFGSAVTLLMLAYFIKSKRRILLRGDPEKTDLDMISFNSYSGVSKEIDKDTSLVVVFPNNTDDIKDLTVCDIFKATNDFNQANIVGCGGFGLVYKATLPNGTNLAVKKLSGDMGMMEREFRAEVEALSTTQHKNLVSLQGYCLHDGFRLLMYSYMENGSLDYWLHEKTDGAAQLDWPTRLRIAQGASCGLAYMHQICEPHIVHRDIKSSNILLDEKFEAHVADFGLSRLILPHHTHVSTELVGTLGYIPPEYAQAWIATLRGDMYSFGVVMLELLTGKRPVEVFKPRMSRELVVWVQQMRSEGKQDQVFDPLMRGKGFEEEMLQVLDVSCMCVSENPFNRPTIKEVVDWLKNVGANRQTPK